MRQRTHITRSHTEILLKLFEIWMICGWMQTTTINFSEFSVFVSVSGLCGSSSFFSFSLCLPLSFSCSFARSLCFCPHSLFEFAFTWNRNPHSATTLYMLGGIEMHRKISTIYFFWVEVSVWLYLFSTSILCICLSYFLCLSFYLSLEVLLSVTNYFMPHTQNTVYRFSMNGFTRVIQKLRIVCWFIKFSFKLLIYSPSINPVTVLFICCNKSKSATYLLIYLMLYFPENTVSVFYHFASTLSFPICNFLKCELFSAFP